MKKVSAKTIESITKEVPNYIYSMSLGEKTIDIEIKPYLTYEECYRFILEIIESSFDDNNNYNELMHQAAIVYASLKYFTNINTETSIETLWNFWYATEIENVISENSCKTRFTYEDLILAAEDRIYRMEHMDTASNFDKLCEKALAYIDSFPNVGELTNGLDNDTVKALLNDIKNADWKQLVEEILNNRENSQEPLLKEI